MRPIDGDALRGALEETPIRLAVDKGKMFMLIEQTPTLDLEPVRHGRWIKTKEPLGWNEVDAVECSVCHESWLGDEDDSFDYLTVWHFCPTCGAKMDLEEQND